MSPQRPVAVIGASGRQGSAVVDALLARGRRVRALLRDPASDAGRRLRAAGAETSPFDLDDPESIVSGLTDVDAAFAMTTFGGPRGTEGEVEHGYAIAAGAERARVPHVVYSSVGGAERGTGIPHFESKRLVELRLAESVPLTVVRPVFFMENLSALVRSHDPDAVLRLALPADIPLQLVATVDIGRVAAALLVDPGARVGGSIEIAGDELTGPQMAERVARRTGRSVRYEEIPVTAVGDADRRAMFTWFSHPPAYRADFAATRAIDPDVLDFDAWVTSVAGAG